MPATETLSPESALPRMVTQRRESVEAISLRRPVLLVFLRHFGCTFCREAMADLADKRAEFEECGIRLVLVHMTTPDVAEKWFAKYRLGGVDYVCDEQCAYYDAFGLTKGNFHQLFGLHAWIRGFDAGLVQGHWVGTQQLGDGFQMPGVFSIDKGRVAEAFVHKLASDRPDYWGLLECCAVRRPAGRR